MIPTVVLLFLFVYLFYGNTVPSFEKRIKTKYLVGFVLFLNFIFNIYYFKHFSLELYTTAIAIIVSQASVTGRQFWARRLALHQTSYSVSDEAKEHDLIFLILTSIGTSLGGVFIYSLGQHLVVPASAIIIFCLVMGAFIKSHVKYLVPASSIYFAIGVWAIVKMLRHIHLLDIHTIEYQIAYAVALFIGIIWFLRKPSASPLICLTFCELIVAAWEISYNFAHVSIELYRSILIAVVIFLLVWEIILPLSLAYIGFKQMKNAK